MSLHSMEMDYLSTADALRRLLLMYEGVTIDRMRTHPSGYATVTMRIAEPKTIARFACWASSSNVGMLVWGESRCETEEEWASPDRLRYELRSGPNEALDPAEEKDWVFSIQLFCARMVYDLVKKHRLSLDEANRLLAEWKLGPWSQSDFADDSKKD